MQHIDYHKGVAFYHCNSLAISISSRNTVFVKSGWTKMLSCGESLSHTLIKQIN